MSRLLLLLLFSSIAFAAANEDSAGVTDFDVSMWAKSEMTHEASAADCKTSCQPPCIAYTYNNGECRKAKCGEVAFKFAPYPSDFNRVAIFQRANGIVDPNGQEMEAISNVYNVSYNCPADSQGSDNDVFNGGEVMMTFNVSVMVKSEVAEEVECKTPCGPGCLIYHSGGSRCMKFRCGEEWPVYKLSLREDTEESNVNAVKSHLRISFNCLAEELYRDSHQIATKLNREKLAKGYHVYASNEKTDLGAPIEKEELMGRLVASSASIDLVKKLCPEHATCLKTLCHKDSANDILTLVDFGASCDSTLRPLGFVAQEKCCGASILVQEYMGSTGIFRSTTMYYYGQSPMGLSINEGDTRFFLWGPRF